MNLPVDLLRTLVTIVDTGSIVKASEHIFLTQSALSLQMKRLADIVEQPIFQRFQNSMVLTPAGETLLEHARKVLALNDDVVTKLGAQLVGPVRIGMVQEFAEIILSGILSRFRRAHPDIQLVIKIASSAELREMFEARLLDMALYLGDRAGKYTVSEAEILWLGDPELLLLPVIPVAVMSKPCLFRDIALAELDRRGTPYSIVMETPSTAVLRAAVESGLAITNRTRAFVPDSLPLIDLGFEGHPTITYDLGVAKALHPAVERLADLVRAAILARSG